MPIASSWSEERVEQLKKLFEAGLSCSQIAAELGHVTRNAVIGKLHRLGLGNLRPKKEASPRPARPARTRKAVLRQVLASRDEAHVEAEALDPAILDAPCTATEFDDRIPAEQRKGVLDLEYGDCRWPFGDPTTPEFFFCGARALAGGLPYCGRHSRMAYTTAAQRERNLSPEERARRVALGQRMAARNRGPRATAS